MSVEGPCSFLLRCCPVVAETVTNGFRGLTYVYFGAFCADDGIDEVSAGTCEVVGEGGGFVW